MALDLSGVFNSLAIKNSMGSSYSSTEDKALVLQKLYNLQAHLENINDISNLEIVDTIIDYIENFDKSLTVEVKKILNDISQKTNFK